MAKLEVSLVKSDFVPAALRITFPAPGMPFVTEPGSGGRAAIAGSARSASSAAPSDHGALPALAVEVVDWQADDFPFHAFDRLVDELAQRTYGAGAGAEAMGPAARWFSIELRGDVRGLENGSLETAARQVMERCQRFTGRRNAVSRGDTFERALAAQRGLFDLSQAADAAAYARALDTWQWLLRLDPEAGLAPQLAALFRGLGNPTGVPAAERSEESWGRDMRRGAMTADELCAELGIDLATRVRVHRLMDCLRPPAAGRAATAEATALDAARALSFFSLDAAARLADAGAEWTERVALHHLARLTPRGRAQLEALRLPAVLLDLVKSSAGAPQPMLESRESRESRELREQGESREPRASRTPRTERASRAAAAVAAGASGSADRRRLAGPAAAGAGGRLTPAMVMARSRMAAGLLGGDGFARTRVGAWLARAAAIGALAGGAVSPASPPRAPHARDAVASRL